jgi:hypothetical protein
MKTLKRIRYNTMNSWNGSTAPAYNLKVYNVIDRELQSKVLALMQCEEFYDTINDMIAVFDTLSDHTWQAGFNGRSGGYLVLYKGGKRPSQYKTVCKDCRQKNYRSDTTKCGYCGSENMQPYTGFEVYSMPGQSIDEKEVPTEVLKAFRQLAVNIVLCAESMARENTVTDEVYTVEKTRKVLQPV